MFRAGEAVLNIQRGCIRAEHALNAGTEPNGEEEMMKKFMYMLSAAAVISTGVAYADETTEALRAEMDALKERLEAVEKKETEKKSDWTDKITIKGDIRARYENVEKAGDTSKSRMRGRARVGVYADVNDQVYAGVRIATGSDDSPTSTNQSLDKWSSKRAIWLDLMYMGYTPDAVEGLDVVLGKIKQPWEQVSDLMYDSDVNPEGANLGYSREFEGVELIANAGWFIWQDTVNDNPASDVTMGAAQLAGKIGLGEKLSLTAGANAMVYHNMKGAQVPNDDGDAHLSKGNTTTVIAADNATWNYDYELVEGFARLDLKNDVAPVKIYADYIVNTASDVQEDTAWLIGAGTSYKRLGLDYNYRDIEADAVVGVLADSDFAGGGTGGKGHKFKVSYKLLKNWTAGVTYFLAENGGGTDVNTLQADLEVKF